MERRAPLALLAARVSNSRRDQVIVAQEKMQYRLRALRTRNDFDGVQILLSDMDSGGSVIATQAQDSKAFQMRF
eukprot:2113955-Prorocentrum_lima.AAC.1